MHNTTSKYGVPVSEVFFKYRELDRRRRKRVEASGGRIPRLGERVECCRLHGIQEERRVQLQDRQNKVQDQQAIRRIKGTGQAGSSCRTGKTRYRILRQCAE
jgi:hypothetical protein